MRRTPVPGKHIAMALRHCTAMLMCGKTIAHYLHKYRRKGGAPKPGTIVIIDEWSEVQLHTWIELAQWKLVGVIFIIVADADGQRAPSQPRTAQGAAGTACSQPVRRRATAANRNSNTTEPRGLPNCHR